MNSAVPLALQDRAFFEKVRRSYCSHTSSQRGFFGALCGLVGGAVVIGPVLSVGPRAAPPWTAIVASRPPLICETRTQSVSEIDGRRRCWSRGVRRRRPSTLSRLALDACPNPALRCAGIAAAVGLAYRDFYVQSCRAGNYDSVLRDELLAAIQGHISPEGQAVPSPPSAFWADLRALHAEEVQSRIQGDAAAEASE